MSDLKHHKEICWGLGIFFVFAFIWGSIFGFIKGKDKKIVFENDNLKVVTKNKTELYNLTQLEKIYRPSDKDIKQTGIDYFYIKFANRKKIIFSNQEPYYIELRSYVKNYFLSEIEYKKYLTGNDL